MTMKLGWNNRVDDADLAASNQIATLPAGNVKHPYLSKQWRTQAGVTAANLILDLGSALECEIYALVGTNLTSGATLQIRASDVDPTVIATLLYDSGVVSAGVDNNYRTIYGVLSAKTTARYWRFDISDGAAVGGNLRIGRFWLGPAWTPSANLSYGWSKTFLDGSRITETRSGAEFIDQGPRARVFDFQLSFMTKAEMMANAFEIARRNGLTRDVLVLVDPNGPTIHEDSVLGLIKRADPLVEEKLKINRQRYVIKERVSNGV